MLDVQKRNLKHEEALRPERGWAEQSRVERIKIRTEKGSRCSQSPLRAAEVDLQSPKRVRKARLGRSPTQQVAEMWKSRSNRRRIPVNRRRVSATGFSPDTQSARPPARPPVGPPPGLPFVGPPQSAAPPPTALDYAYAKALLLGRLSTPRARVSSPRRPPSLPPSLPRPAVVGPLHPAARDLGLGIFCRKAGRQAGLSSRPGSGFPLDSSTRHPGPPVTVATTTRRNSPLLFPSRRGAVTGSLLSRMRTPFDGRPSSTGRPD
ncbi:hypothetical protein Mp_8g02030 [Marchantia polymorpha subsp. ruderalis]|uniref:Uncharacterized protein n=1 Tax=Marchantia polymorpha TaxID=3197 RepID=A0A2R6XIW6_MARPO|nr:hypothetical protein MARPO_0012s0002 [Marchantia polymorpha]BBN18370.1 hypothetical protein Mp_8g02030 [Marchantia polymorpha subsp. ruderalis]|eukprot:PTQ46019.1 hypothetical protein MARPO_0012s0002 [Marchantia polymorpha]